MVDCEGFRHILPGEPLHTKRKDPGPPEHTIMAQSERRNKTEW